MSYYDNVTNSYTVVFQVQLYSPDYLSAPNPNGDQTAAAMAATRSTWIPMSNNGGRVPGTYDSEHANGGASGGSAGNRQFKHGDQFTAYDMDAYYLKANYLYDPVANPNGVLTIVSETL